MHINYPYTVMATGSADIGSAHRKILDLQNQLQAVMDTKLAPAYQSQEGSVQLAQVKQLLIQANDEINQLLARKGVALDDAWMGIRRRDVSAANNLMGIV